VCVPGSFLRFDLELVPKQTSSVQYQGSSFHPSVESLCRRDARHEGYCSNHREGHTIETPVDKKGTTKKRMVLDISRLNKFIPCQKFKMTTAKSVRQVISK